MNTRIALGTAQLGMDYGISNTRGKIPYQEALQILEYALRNGIDTFDTAYIYGDSEKVIGDFVKQAQPNMKIVSKLTSGGEMSVNDMVIDSLRRMNVKSIYAYLVHDFNAYVKNPALWDELCALKKSGRIQKIGFSLYHPRDLQYLLDHRVAIDLVQVPFSVFDQRFLPLLPLLKRMGIEIHVRSVFLQGLVFKNASELGGQFVKLKSKLEHLRALSQQFNLSVVALCTHFALFNSDIDKVIIGVDSLDNLKENISGDIDQDVFKRAYPQLLPLAETDENIIIPSNWQSKRQQGVR